MTHPLLTRTAPREAQARAAAAPPFDLKLSELDLDLLGLACGLRVITQTQIERLLPDVPSRTVRYRTRRLASLGLLGRTRPYRNPGSAPHHLWPTNRADALVRAEAPPRRGERRPPNPLFLEHSAALSELYVALETRTRHQGLTLVGFDREGQARVDFPDANGNARAIVPDARITLLDGHGVRASANVELDLGTMTHARLRMKLKGFLAHAAWHADRDHDTPPPALLFITTSTQRRDRFLEAADKLRRRNLRCAPPFSVAASAAATRLDEAVMQRCWRQVPEVAQWMTLPECLTTGPPATPSRLQLGAVPA